MGVSTVNKLRCVSERRTGHFEGEEVGEPALLGGLRGEIVRAGREDVLLLAAHLKRRRQPVRRVPHHLVRAVLRDRRDLFTFIIYFNSLIQKLKEQGYV